VTGGSRIEQARLRLPIRVKLAAVSAALTFAILLAFAIVIGAVAESRIRAGFDDDLRATASELQDQVGPPSIAPDGDLEVNGDPLRYAAAGGALVRVVRAHDGAVMFPEGAAPLAPVEVEGVIDIGDYRVVSRPLVRSIRESRGLFDSPGALAAEALAYIQYGKSEASLLRTIKRVRLFLAFGVLGGTMLAFLAGLFLARRAMRPIAGLTRAAREVARTRDPDITLPKPTANDEVSDLARTFEDMLRELTAARGETESTLARQREFVADASHELRTPLTSILANLELLETELEGEQREIAGSALRSSRRMRRLVADLLLLARADAGRRSPKRPLDLVEVVVEAADEAASLASGHPLELDVTEPVVVEGVADDLHRMAGNLVENALLHTPPGTPVTVSVRRRDGSAVLEVADRGPGVPAEQRDRIFERFVRADGDSAPAGGSGLGLAIVRAVARAHGGDVAVGDAAGGGARFVVTLQLADSSSDRSDPETAVFKRRN
jgi:two-component system, OmpR family, sensor kinase